MRGHSMTSSHSSRSLLTLMLTGVSALAGLLVPAVPLLAQTSFVYQGRLTENGQAATGSYDIDFRLIDPFNSGNEVARFCRVGVPVIDGLFSTTIDLGSFNRDLTYTIRIRTRTSTGLACDNDTGFTTLVPDQFIGATPRAIHAMNASSLSSPDGSPATAALVNADGTLITLGNLQVNGSIGLGTTSPLARLDMRSDDSGFFRFLGTSADFHFDGGTDGVFGFYNVDPTASGSTVFVNGGNTRLSIGNNGRVGINTNTPGKTLTVAGDMELGTSAGDYKHFRIGGGNSSGFLYGSFPALGDGIHMSYNYYHNQVGSGVIANSGGGSSRVSTGYGTVVLATGDIGQAPTDRLVVNVSGNVGINNTSPTFRLDVGGAIRCTSLTQTSSQEFKDDIAPLSLGVDELVRLAPVSYVWNSKAPEETRGRHDLGLIAEDVARVLPDAVALDPDGHAVGIDYSRVTVLAVKAIQEQQAEIQEQRATIQSQKAKIESLTARLERLERAMKETTPR
ncbi:MAG: tail fiber domain-containing protein [Phycisphaerales bacterium]